MRRHSSSHDTPLASPNVQKGKDWNTIQTLLPYLWAYKWRVLIALVLLIGAKLANVGVPLVL